MTKRSLERLAVKVHDGELTRRDFMRRAAQAGVALSTASALLMATSGVARSAVSGDITMIKGPHHANEFDFEAMIIDDFKGVAPDVNVEFTVYDWANMNAQLTSLFAGGSPPDVLYLVDLIYPFFAGKGLLHDVTPLISDSAWSSERAAIEPFSWALATQQGGIWGVPVLGAVFNIFTNNDLLDAAGVTDTWSTSYESIMEAAKKLNQGDVHGFAMRTKTPDFAFWDWFPYMHNAGAQILNSDWSGCGLDNPDAVAAMQFLIDMHEAGVTPPIGQVDWQGQVDLFKAGRIGIMHGETPRITDLLANPVDFTWDISLAPPGPKNRVAMGNFGFLCIAEASKNKEAAWEFIKHWASGPQVGRFAEQVNLQVVRSDIVGGLWQDNPFMQRVQAEFVPTVIGVQPHESMLQMLQSMWPTAQNAYRGNLTGQQAIDEMCATIEGAL